MSDSENTLIILVGLPQSGKSTYAATLGYPIVNLDLIRIALHGQVFNQDMEEFVWAYAKTLVKLEFLRGNTHVVLDATNTRRSRRNYWYGNWKRKFHIIDTSIKICVERAIVNGRKDLLPVIERMNANYEAPTVDEGLII